MYFCFIFYRMFFFFYLLNELLYVEQRLTYTEEKRRTRHRNMERQKNKYRLDWDSKGQRREQIRINDTGGGKTKYQEHKV